MERLPLVQNAALNLDLHITQVPSFFHQAMIMNLHPPKLIRMKVLCSSSLVKEKQQVGKISK